METQSTSVSMAAYILLVWSIFNGPSQTAGEQAHTIAMLVSMATRTNTASTFLSSLASTFEQSTNPSVSISSETTSANYIDTSITTSLIAEVKSRDSSLTTALMTAEVQSTTLNTISPPIATDAQSTNLNTASSQMTTEVQSAKTNTSSPVTTDVQTTKLNTASSPMVPDVQSTKFNTTSSPVTTEVLSTLFNTTSSPVTTDVQSTKFNTTSSPMVTDVQSIIFKTTSSPVTTEDQSTKFNTTSSPIATVVHSGTIALSMTTEAYSTESGSITSPKTIQYKYSSTKSSPNTNEVKSTESSTKSSPFTAEEKSTDSSTESSTITTEVESTDSFTKSSPITTEVKFTESSTKSSPITTEVKSTESSTKSSPIATEVKSTDSSTKSSPITTEGKSTDSSTKSLPITTEVKSTDSSTKSSPIKTEEKSTESNGSPITTTSEMRSNLSYTVSVDKILIRISHEITASNATFDSDLLNATSKLFLNYSMEFKIQLKRLYNSIPGFLDVDIIQFSNGSIHCHYSALFQRITPSQLRSLLNQQEEQIIHLKLLDIGAITVSVNFTEIADSVIQGTCELFERIPCDRGYLCVTSHSRDFITCRHPCDVHSNVCQNGGECMKYPDHSNTTICRCKEDWNYVYTGDHCEVKVERLALESKYIAAIAGSVGGAISIAAIAVIACLAYRRRIKLSEEGHDDHPVGLMDYKERTSHKKPAKSNTYWDAPVAGATSDFHALKTGTDRDTPLTRGISDSHPHAYKIDLDAHTNQKACNPLPYANDTDCEEQEKRRGRYYHPSAKNTYWDALDARGSRDSHPYSSNYEFRKSENLMGMEERKHHVATGGMGPEKSLDQPRLPHGANVRRSQSWHFAEGDLYRSRNSQSQYDSADSALHAKVVNV